MGYNMDKLDVYKKPEKTVYGFWFHLYRILKNANWFIVIESRSVLALGTGVRVVQDRRIYQQEKTFWNNKYVHYLDGYNGFMSIYRCQN